MGHQLLGHLVAADKVVLHEGDQAIRVRIVLVLEVDSVGALLNANGLLVSIVFQNKLLKVEEGTLVVNALSHLDLRYPGMWRPSLFTVIALHVNDDELNLEGLLQQGVRVHFLLDGQLDFYPTGMRFCPDEVSIDQFDPLHASHVLETKS